MTIGGADPEEVRRMYWEDGMSTRAIGEALGVSQSAVFRGMERHGIKRRSRAVAQGNDLPGGLSLHGLEAMVGEMLGDGHLRSDFEHSAGFDLAVADRAHRDWLKGFLEEEGFSCRTSERPAQKGSGTVYGLRTLYYPCLRDIWETWYTGPTNPGTSSRNPSKRVPVGVEVTSTVLLHWWLGDGTPVDGRGQIRIAAQGFTGAGRDRLVSALAAEGIEASHWSDGSIGVRADSHDRFFDHMADPPAGVKPRRFPEARA